MSKLKFKPQPWPLFLEESGTAVTVDSARQTQARSGVEAGRDHQTLADENLATPARLFELDPVAPPPPKTGRGRTGRQPATTGREDLPLKPGKTTGAGKSIS